jgi:hypothetical protein
VPAPSGGDDTAAIEAAEAATPDGGTLCFVAGAVYRLEGTFEILDRNDLTIEGRDATLVAPTLVGDLDPGPKVNGREHVLVKDGTGTTIRDLHVRSANTSCAYQSAFEFEHGFSVVGAEDLLLTGVSARNVGGDGLQVSEHNDSPGALTERATKAPSPGAPTERATKAPSPGAPTERATNVRVEDSTFICIGRQGMSVTDVNGLTVRRSTFDRIARSAVDFEPIRRTAVIENVHITRNTFTAFTNYWAGGAGMSGAVMRDIVFKQNTATRLVMKTGTRDRIVDRVGWTFIGNVGLEPIPRDGNAARTAFSFLGALNIRVVGNRQAFISEFPTAGVTVFESSDVFVADNDFLGVDLACAGC